MDLPKVYQKLKTSTFSIHDKQLPWLLLALTVAVFGLLIPSLGFYWDDWLTIYMLRTKSVASDLIYFPYRPLYAWLDVIEFPLLGSNPIHWQIFSLLLRWLAIILVWDVILHIWPNQREFAAFSTILFAIYPSFLQQSSAVTYRQHWTGLILFLLSIRLMLAASRPQSKSTLFAILSVILTISHLLISEYLIGLELLRPLILRITGDEKVANEGKRGALVLRAWLPYLLTLAIFAAWRLFFVTTEFEPNPPVLFYKFIAGPLKTIIQLTQSAFQDLAFVLWTSWAQTIQPQLFDFADRFGTFAWGYALFVAIIIYLVFRRMTYPSNKSNQGEENSPILFGLAGTVLGLIPSWIVGRQAAIGLFSDRLTIPAMFGASIFISALIFRLLSTRSHRVLILASLIFLSTALHLRTANEYRWDWERQERFAWEMYWRAPSLAPDTLIMSNGVVSTYLSRYNAALALNIIYNSSGGLDNPDYWYKEFYTGLQNEVANFRQGFDISYDFYGIEFSTKSQNSILLFRESSESPCWWFISPLDIHNHIITEEFRTLAPYIDFENTISGDKYSVSPPADIFGTEPSGYWCKYYDQASFAMQESNPEIAMELFDEARALGLNPYSGFEYLPFIQAQIALEQWSKAKAFTIQAYKVSLSSGQVLCSIWDQTRQSKTSSSDLNSAFFEINDRLRCGY